MPKEKIRSLHPILLAEDNPDDVVITERALKKSGVQNELYIARDGEEAIQFLKKKGEYRDAPTPALVLLDLKMPKIDGFGVLEEIKKDDDTKSIPIIILTTSGRDKDVERAYKLGCNSYIIKPVNSEKFIKTLEDIRNYWLTVSKIPTE